MGSPVPARAIALTSSALRNEVCIRACLGLYGIRPVCLSVVRTAISFRAPLSHLSAASLLLVALSAPFKGVLCLQEVPEKGVEARTLEIAVGKVSVGQINVYQTIPDNTVVGRRIGGGVVQGMKITKSRKGTTTARTVIVTRT